MKLVRLLDCGASGTRLGVFMEALMRGFNPEEFVMIVGRIDYNLVLYQKEGWNDERKAEFLRHWKDMIELSKKFGLTTTSHYLESIVHDLTTDIDWFLKHLDEAVRNTRRVLYEEMRGLRYFEIAPHKVAFWELKNPPFGQLFNERFPDAVYDIEQASRCIALDRSTSSVFHLMRALELVLKEFWSHINAATPRSQNWGDIIKVVEDTVNAIHKTDPKKEDYERILGYLKAVKNAWRNPTMHPKKQYDEEEAEDVFCTMRAFCRDVVKVI